MEKMKKYSETESILLHTGQHYDASTSQNSFLMIWVFRNRIYIYLGVGSANHGNQTGKIMMVFEFVLLKEKPDIVIVVSDVNSTIICSLVAVKQCVKVAHVEAGLRSFDRDMPEEINRLLTDQISDFLFVTEKSGEENLLKERIDKNKIHFVGNVMKVMY